MYPSYYKRLPRRFSYVLGLLIVCLLVLLPVRQVSAHPLGNFTVNRYSRIAVVGEQLRVQYVVDMAEIPAFQERQQIDSDQDQMVSATEQATYLSSQIELLRRNVHLQVNGTPLQLEAITPLLEFPVGQGGLETLRISAELVANVVDRGTTWEASYRDDNYAGRLGWQEIVVQPGQDVQLLHSSVPAEDRSQALRNYPQDLLSNPLAITSATFSWKEGVGSLSTVTSGAMAAPTQERTPDRFAALIAAPALEGRGLLFAVLLSIGLGAAHALSPGHGKTIVAAYLVGSRGTAKHAIFLGLTTTITHTAGVFALGFITLFISRWILPEQLYPWLGVLSGLLVVAIGASLFSTRLRGLLGLQAAHHHTPDDPQLNDQTASFLHTHGGGRPHSHLPSATQGGRVTWRSLFALGVSGGIIPCPSALVVLLGAIALNRVGLGLLLIVAFSLGLAGVLTIIGVLLVYAGRLFERIPIRGKLFQVVPVASALFITVVGVGIVFQALVQTGLLRL